MKKFLRLATISTGLVMVAGMCAGANMENPLYLPATGEIYSKTGAAVMYKRADHTAAMRNKKMAGDSEFPIWRFTEDAGYGITDRLAIQGRFGWTQDDDINRKGMHRGRIGFIYRIFSEQAPIVWDVYSDLYLSGAIDMKGAYGLDGFSYHNYSNGRWGVYGGTKIGKTWNKFTLAGFGEYLQTFGSHNNEITIDGQLVQMGFPDEISVDLKGTHEINAGVMGFYQFDDCWAFGLGFEYNQHTDNGVKGVYTKSNTQIPAPIMNMLLQQTADMDEGWDEYIAKMVATRQITENIQLAVFGEYTFDKSHPNSQNGTDIKAELGVRVNMRF